MPEIFHLFFDYPISRFRRIEKQYSEILEIGFTDGGNRYDGNKPYPHPHLICTQCKTIIDPDINLIDQISSELEKNSGYKIKSHQIEFFGICPSCQEE
jgi:Fur family peroxide stress response transcriptional regulator